MKLEKIAFVFFAFVCTFSFFSCSDEDEGLNKYDSNMVGNVILNDGTVVTPDKITEEQKSNAVAVIILNNGKKRLGVGLKQNQKDSKGEVLAWCDKNAQAANKIITTIQCKVKGEKEYYTFEGDTDGSDNLEQIGEFLKANNLEDDTTTLSNYPDFAFAKEYKTHATNLGKYEDGWYLPSIEELYIIYKNRTKINKALTLLNADTFGIIWNRSWYISSSQTPDANNMQCIRVVDAQISKGKKTDLHQGYVCAIRKF